MGLRGVAKGANLAYVLLVLMALLSCTVMVYAHDANTVKKMESITEMQQKIIDEVSALTYVLTLSPEERGKLRMEMPDALRKKLRDQR